MAKVRKHVRKPIRRHHHCEPRESKLTIYIPCKLGKHKALATMTAVDGGLYFRVASSGHATEYISINGLELHTALHALGFARLNDRDGWG
jgi:hypothetical protein